MGIMRKIVFWTLFAIISSLAQVMCWSDGEQEVFTNHHKECVETSGVGVKVLEDAYEGRVIDDVNLKRYINCFFTKSGFQSENGEMRYDAIRSFIPHMVRTKEGDPEAKIIACGAKRLVGETPEDTAFLHFKCYLGTV